MINVLNPPIRLYKLIHEGSKMRFFTKIVASLVCASFPSANAETLIEPIELVSNTLQSDTPTETLISQLKTSTNQYLNETATSLVESEKGVTIVNLDWFSNDRDAGEIVIVRPLFEESEYSATFWQGSLFFDESQTTGNIGAGKRWLTENEHWLYGFNIFYDHEFRVGHRRIGLGGELLSGPIEFRANSYHPLTGNLSNGTGEEVALDGWDAKVSIAIPYTTGLKANYLKESWNDRKGGIGADFETLSLSGQITPRVSIEAGTSSNAVGGNDEFIKLSYNLTGQNAQLSATEQAWNWTSMRPYFYKQVQRQNRIKVSKVGLFTIKAQ